MITSVILVNQKLETVITFHVWLSFKLRCLSKSSDRAAAMAQEALIVLTLLQFVDSRRVALEFGGDW